MCAVPSCSSRTRTDWSRPAAWTVRSVSWASAAIVHAPVTGLKAGPSAGSGPAGSNAAYRTAAATRTAAARLTSGSRRGRRRRPGAGAATACGGSATAVSTVTLASLRLRLFFRRLVLAAARDFGHDGGVGQRGRVPERTVLGHVAQEATHDLARARLRQLGREDDVGRRRELADHAADVVTKLFQYLRRTFLAALQRDEGHDRLPRLRVVAPRDRGLGDRGMADQRAFHLDRRDAMAGDVHHVVDAAEEPEIAVLVDARSVTDEVRVLPAVPVSLLVPLRVAKNAAQHCRPGLADDEVATTAGGHLLALVVEDCGVDGGEGLRRASGLQGGDAWQGRDEDHARLGLPPRVDDGR